MADALASGASGSNVVWVQVPSSAPKNQEHPNVVSGVSDFFMNNN